MVFWFHFHSWDNFLVFFLKFQDNYKENKLKVMARSEQITVSEHGFKEQLIFQTQVINIFTLFNWDGGV